MTSETLLQEEVNTMKRHFGGLISLVKDLKVKVEKMEKNFEPIGKKGIKEIVEKQSALDKLFEENSNSIKQIEKQIKEMESENTKRTEIKDTEVEEIKDEETKKSIKKCRYFNKGYCKYTVKCRYFHPEEICKDHLKSQHCKVKHCKDRHPKVCKWVEKERGCRRHNCEFLHDTIAKEESVKYVKADSYQCAGCKHTWQDEKCVVKQTIENKDICLCLNCDDWIINKSEVLKSDWTLLDQRGDLRQDV